MALQTITLTLASRHIIQVLLSDVPSVDVAKARLIRDVRRRLDLKEVQREVNALDEEARQMGLRVSWETILAYEEEVDESPREYTLDDSYIKFVQELMSARNWNESKVETQGGMQTIQVAVPAAMAEAIADLADALAEAKNA